MKHENKATFKAATAPPKAPLKPLSMMDAIRAAKAAVLEMTAMQADSITECQRADDGGWRISVDVIESAARMGDNDLLATYEVQIGADAELLHYARLRRYHREDKGA